MLLFGWDAPNIIRGQMFALLATSDMVVPHALAVFDPLLVSTELLFFLSDFLSLLLFPFVHGQLFGFLLSFPLKVKFSIFFPIVLNPLPLLLLLLVLLLQLVFCFLPHSFHFYSLFFFLKLCLLLCKLLPHLFFRFLRFF